MTPQTLRRSIASFRRFGTRSVRTTTLGVPTYTNEFWTSRQRAASSLHEVSYRACFKPQLPRFFIERLTRPGHVVYDPFMGRGTTVLEAALNRRRAVGCDASPLSPVLVGPRLRPPTLEEVAHRLESIDFSRRGQEPRELRVFYHPRTLRMLGALRRYLTEREASGALDEVDGWIRMVAVNRLTGHSSGFFSVYTLPPNQAVSVESQRKINRRRKQKPPVRDVPALILKKTRSLLKDCDGDARFSLHGTSAELLTGPAADTPDLADASVHLVVTSPPFLDVVNYAKDNWLRCWFCGIDPESVDLTVVRSLAEWEAAMEEVFLELHRVLVPGGHVAFEVGEVRGGKVKLEETVLPCAERAGLNPVLVLVNAQEFTKTANCWGVTNGKRGTNTNRVVLLRK